LDNVFVFVVALAAFAVPAEVRPWAVAWAIAAAHALRAVFILAGSAMLGAAGWTAYLFAAFLIVTGLKLVKGAPSAADPAHSRLVRAVSRVIPTVPGYDGRRLLVRRGRRLYATPLVGVLVVLAATDVAFAADSIPSIFAVTRDPLIVFAANVMALVGLPSLFVLLEGMRDRFVHLNLGLAAVLVLTGIEMATAELYHPPAAATLTAALEQTAYVRPLVAAFDEGRPAGVMVAGVASVQLFQWQMGAVDEVGEYRFAGASASWRRGGAPLAAGLAGEVRDIAAERAWR